MKHQILNAVSLMPSFDLLLRLQLLLFTRTHAAKTRKEPIAIMSISEYIGENIYSLGSLFCNKFYISDKYFIS